VGLVCGCDVDTGIVVGGGGVVCCRGAEQESRDYM
jgi:hypothetical protein